MKKNSNKAFAAIGLSLMLCLGGCSGSSASASGSAESKFKAGTYTGSAAGKNGDVKVEVTLSSDKITDVKVTEHQETEGISDPAIEQVPAAIVEAQSLKVDTVSGATITSQAIIDAASAALTSAGVDPASLSK